MTTHISDGLHQHKPYDYTIITGLDLIKAFDTVFYYILLRKSLNFILADSIKSSYHSISIIEKHYAELKNATKS